MSEELANGEFCGIQAFHSSLVGTLTTFVMPQFMQKSNITKKIYAQFSLLDVHFLNICMSHLPGSNEPKGSLLVRLTPEMRLNGR